MAHGFKVLLFYFLKHHVALSIEVPGWLARLTHAPLTLSPQNIWSLCQSVKRSRSFKDWCQSLFTKQSEEKWLVLPHCPRGTETPATIQTCKFLKVIFIFLYLTVASGELSTFFMHQHVLLFPVVPFYLWPSDLLGADHHNMFDSPHNSAAIAIHNISYYPVWGDCRCYEEGSY